MQFWSFIGTNGICDYYSTKQIDIFDFCCTGGCLRRCEVEIFTYAYKVTRKSTPKLNSFPRERTAHFNTNESFAVFFFQLSKYPFSGWPRLVTLLGTNISPWKVHFESMIFRTFFSGGICIHFLEGNHHLSLLSPLIRPYFQGIFMLNFRGWFFQTLHESSRCFQPPGWWFLAIPLGMPKGGKLSQKTRGGLPRVGSMATGWMELR